MGTDPFPCYCKHQPGTTCVLTKLHLITHQLNCFRSAPKYHRAMTRAEYVSRKPRAFLKSPSSSIADTTFHKWHDASSSRYGMASGCFNRVWYRIVQREGLRSSLSRRPVRCTGRELVIAGVVNLAAKHLQGHLRPLCPFRTSNAQRMQTSRSWGPLQLQARGTSRSQAE